MPRLVQRFEGLTLEPYARYLLPLPPAWSGNRFMVGGCLQVAEAVPLSPVGWCLPRD